MQGSVVLSGAAAKDACVRDGIQPGADVVWDEVRSKHMRTFSL